ncbi:unnamed protein product [Haemonchus placei]|uniref:Uncharacterized protein n=1 Tax=Haemonchus placei TaxID=6290 RepID=A0A0N4WC54_HAEPC|nr:unnamed protein product [Haemonchus placei]
MQHVLVDLSFSVSDVRPVRTMWQSFLTQLFEGKSKC